MVQSPATPRAVSAARSREALIDAALSRFARDGFDATPTDRIAEDAGVSPRTFFRYFPTKEDVLFVDSDARRERLLAVLAEQPVGEPPFRVLQAAMRVRGFLSEQKPKPQESVSGRSQ